MTPNQEPTRGIDYRNDPHFFDKGYDKEEFVNVDEQGGGQ